MGSTDPLAPERFALLVKFGARRAAAFHAAPAFHAARSHETDQVDLESTASTVSAALGRAATAEPERAAVSRLDLESAVGPPDAARAVTVESAASAGAAFGRPDIESAASAAAFGRPDVESAASAAAFGRPDIESAASAAAFGRPDTESAARPDTVSATSAATVESAAFGSAPTEPGAAPAAASLAVCGLTLRGLLDHRLPW
jgi:hypothetical protein